MKHLLKAVPVLASLDIDKTVNFYTTKLGFKATYHDAGYGIVVRDDIAIHFWKCDDKIFPENTSCYVDVQEVDQLYQEMEQVGVIHPNGKLEDKPWGRREFAILDADGNLIRFGQSL
ncbi:catechol 2,3-dioxygenase-like lactoylglutathione lyase family enzyme [Catalinimonas alkaloidigena]|uniref:bleomycin resistance protein n=1 Tax=Catalinimonas alkaloidigena TaxID=1075417 RepID=UPI0024073935|nr:VOC family protein [Catalinimonas alkaloidigena]MDF9800409.1 catechol 2,3-dioxygenase-like lactoylglutathione lyase family enzyme [Catalinimonas alkaloidigena]